MIRSGAVDLQMCVFDLRQDDDLGRPGTTNVLLLKVDLDVAVDDVCTFLTDNTRLAGL